MSMPWPTASGPARNIFQTIGFAVLVAGSLLATSTRASAHPHIWIDANAEMVFEKEKLTAIKMHWIFDDLFSMTLIDQFDKNFDTRFFGDENTNVHDNAFVALGDVSWLAHLRKNEILIPFTKTRDFKADITDDRRVTYDFTLVLDEPLDPVKDNISLSVYDAEYYIDVAFVQVDPIVFRGNKTTSCHFEMSEDEKNRIYFDLVAPIRADLVCAAKQAQNQSSLGPDAHGLNPDDMVRVD